MNEKLVWKEESRKQVFNCRVFSVYESECKSPKDESKKFSILDAADWAIIIPVLDTQEGKKFVMVRQWRHGSQSLSLEFPGGVFESGENPEEAAARELLEETGYRANSIRKLGEFSPNPAIMANRVHFFLAEGLVDSGILHLDADEFIEVELMDTKEVIQGMGGPPFIHALMASALALYQKN